MRKDSRYNSVLCISEDRRRPSEYIEVVEFWCLEESSAVYVVKRLVLDCREWIVSAGSRNMASSDNSLLEGSSRQAA